MSHTYARRSPGWTAMGSGSGGGGLPTWRKYPTPSDATTTNSTAPTSTRRMGESSTPDRNHTIVRASITPNATRKTRMMRPSIWIDPGMRPSGVWSPAASLDSKGSVQAFDDRRVGHAPTFAHRLESVAAATALKFVQQGGHEPGTGGAERVAEGDGAPVGIHPLLEPGVVDPENLLPPEHDRGEGLVDLHDVDVGLEVEPPALERLAGGGDRLGQHPDGVAAGEGEGVEARPGPEAQRLRLLPAHDQQGRGAVSDLRGVAGGDHPADLGELLADILVEERREQAGHPRPGGRVADT